jgi:dihydrolipoamide dehydrogenase
MIHEAAVLMEFGVPPRIWRAPATPIRLCSEAVKEAALAVGKRAIHM